LSPLIIDDPRRQVVHVASHGRDDSDEEDDYDQTTRFSRLSTASNASLAPEDRVEGLTKANEEAIRKLMDVEATLTRKMAEHEDELATLEARVQELRQELAAKNREEKELRTKDAS
jgi:predicted RNase H-like nuclease (RuvC/YqgF family)